MICRSKWFIPKYLLAPGHEIIAEVNQVGSEVKDFKKGDLVGFGTIREICGKCKYCKQGLEELCRDADYLTYDTHWGGYATTLQKRRKIQVSLLIITKINTMKNYKKKIYLKERRKNLLSFSFRREVNKKDYISKNIRFIRKNKS